MIRTARERQPASAQDMDGKASRVEAQQLERVEARPPELASGAHAGADPIGNLIAVILLHVAKACRQSGASDGIVMYEPALAVHDTSELAQHQCRITRHVRAVAPILGDHVIMKDDREVTADA